MLRVQLNDKQVVECPPDVAAKGEEAVAAWLAEQEKAADPAFVKAAKAARQKGARGVPAPERKQPEGVAAGEPAPARPARKPAVKVKHTAQPADLSGVQPTVPAEQTDTSPAASSSRRRRGSSADSAGGEQ